MWISKKKYEELKRYKIGYIGMQNKLNSINEKYEASISYIKKEKIKIETEKATLESNYNKNVTVLNNLIDENKKLVDWICKILHTCQTVELHSKYPYELKIPIYREKRAYTCCSNSELQNSLKDLYSRESIIVPEIHIEIIK